MANMYTKALHNTHVVKTTC